jgi:hypothetical protein
MRVRNLCVGGAALAALVIPTSVLAATSQQVFRGDLESTEDGSVKLKTGATNSYRVKAFSARNFAVDCEGTDGTINRATIKGRIPIGGQDRFHARDDNGETVVNVRGEIDGRRVEGTFRFAGEVETASGTTHECDSGRLEWEARLADEPDGGP